MITVFTKITEINLSAFVYREFHEDFSSIVWTKFEEIEEKSSWNSLYTNTDTIIFCNLCA